MSRIDKHTRASTSIAEDETPFSVEVPPATARVIVEPSGAAAVAIGALTPGCRVVGITKGQFSLLDLIRACLDQTGPADVLLSTWTTGIRDSETAAWLARKGVIRSLQIITDRSFPARQPAYARRLVSLFGPDAIVCTKTHAKFALVRNEAWSIAIRSSMNLNRNPRFEQFDLDDSAPICDFFAAFAAEVRTRMREGVEITNAEVDVAFDGAFVGAGGDPSGARCSSPSATPSASATAAASSPNHLMSGDEASRILAAARLEIQ